VCRLGPFDSSGSSCVAARGSTEMLPYAPIRASFAIHLRFWKLIPISNTIDTFRVLLALHGSSHQDDLETELRARGWHVEVTRNMADTWSTARAGNLDAMVLSPLGSLEAELSSLMALSESPDGPALLVLTDRPAALEEHAENLDDFLSTADDLDLICRRLRFSIARRRALARMHKDRKSLLRATTTDYKTGLRNDRYFSERCRIDCARSIRDGRCLSLMMLDLDTFKSLNTEFGHPFADEVLAQVGRLLEASLRPFDTAARIGGDEFAILLPDTNLRDAGRIAERLRAQIAGHAFSHGGQTARVKVTIGVAGWDPLRGDSFDDTLRAADTMLLAAKKAGRNRVLLHDPGTSRSNSLEIEASNS